MRCSMDLAYSLRKQLSALDATLNTPGVFFVTAAPAFECCIHDHAALFERRIS